VILLFIGHLIAFLTISRYTQRTQLEVNRGIIARQIVTLIEAVEINPPSKRAYIVNAIDIPNIAISLDRYPKYKLQVSQVRIWDVLLKIKAIPAKATTIKISIKFGRHLWLNISAAIARSSKSFQYLLFAFELLIILVLVFLAWSLNRYNKPLKRFVQAVERTGRNLNAPPLSDQHGPVMVREAAQAVNQMQDRIRHLVQDRTQMLAAISHDLRTPITRLRLRAQLLDDEEQQQKITKDLDEMEKMINESLIFFRDEQLALEKTEVDIASILSSLCLDYKELEYDISYEGPSKSWTMQANALALKRAFSNIIDNALKYGKKADVTLNMNEQNDYVISVIDGGKGIPEEEFANVLKPFYRGEQSRSKATGGIGLGLAVTNSIVLAHDGEIKLERLEPEGFKISIILHNQSSL
jgi:signal transduction histidine kinase